jgi:ferrochelatase
LKLAIILFNLGGPDSPAAVEPFLRNLFSDPAIISLPWALRLPLARFIARRRAPLARAIYGHMGGRSPILEQTEAQARALESELRTRNIDAKVFVAMRAWHPLSEETARAVAAYAPDRLVLLPLYPQFSTTTTASSVEAWRKAAKAAGLNAPESRVCCYPWDKGFVAAVTETIQERLAQRHVELSYRVLFSAHGLPERVIAQGDPYQWQVAAGVEAVMRELQGEVGDWRVSYQSRVGPLRWIAPATDAEIRRAGAEGKSLIVVPIAFVSEHSETLVELDIEYGKLAREAGVPHYLRARTVGVTGAFIGGLADLVLAAANSDRPVNCGGGRICPVDLTRCGFEDVER